jgi:MFS family permease
VSASAATAVPLRRNREFLLLQTAHLLSSLGDRVSFIAYPLLVLAVTGSAAKAGIVGFARLLPSVLFGLAAGVAADRYDRKRLMLGAHVARAVVLGALAVAILADALTFWLIPAAAFVQGTGSTVFAAAQVGALKAVVPRAQLPAAIGAVEARNSTVQLLGPPVGGLLFAVARSFPFVVHTLSYVLSFAALALMRTPFQETRERDRAPLRAQVAEGFRFLWHQPFVRTTTFLYGIGNFSIPGMLLVLIVVAERDGITPAGVGLLLALFGAGTLLGALASPLFRRLLSVRTIMLLEFWTGLLAAAYLLVPSVWVLLAALTVQGITLPVTNSVVDSYRLAIIPDRLLGRVETVASQIGLAIAPLGPLAAGLLLSATSARATVACFLVFSASLVVWGTASRALRNAPDIRNLDAYAQEA